MRTGTVAWRGLKGRPRCAPGGRPFFLFRPDRSMWEETPHGGYSHGGSGPLGRKPLGALATDRTRVAKTIRSDSCRAFSLFAHSLPTAREGSSRPLPYHSLPHFTDSPTPEFFPRDTSAPKDSRPIPCRSWPPAASFLRTSSPAPSTRFGSLAGRVLTPAPRGRI